MAEHYAREAAKIAALQLADSAGFDVVQQSCVDILADLLLRYVQEAGAASHHYAELAGRSETNAVDVALALNDLGTGISQLRDFMRHSPEVPFEANISAFPLRKKSRPPPTFLDRGEAPPPHIPPWLPAMPDRHTYAATPVYPGHEKDPQQRQMKLTEQRQLAETAAVRLQARLAADSNKLLAAKLEATEGAAGAEGAALAAGQGAAAADAAAEQQQQQAAEAGAGAGAGAAAASAGGNPFFAAPWGDLLPNQQPPQLPRQQQQQQQFTSGIVEQQQQAEGPSSGGEPGFKVEWEPTTWEPTSTSGTAASGSRFVAQPLFASRDWKAQQQRRALIVTSGRAVREAFGEAFDEAAAARAGKRQKRAGGIAAAAANDPTRARVEGILAASAQPIVAAAAGAAGQEDLMQEQI